MTGCLTVIILHVQTDTQNNRISSMSTKNPVRIRAESKTLRVLFFRVGFT